MVKLHTLITFLDRYLRTSEFKDSSWNGLQIEGRPDVKKIMLTVDAGIETIRCTDGFDMMIVHHGLFWQETNPSLRGFVKRRVTEILQRGVSLYASHLPLDAHELVGNNVQILKLLKAERSQPFFEHHGKTIGWIGSITPKPVDYFVKMLETSLATKATVLPFGPRMIERIAVCSGGGGYRAMSAALEMGAQLLITGDRVEVYHLARDAGIHVIFAGHHATETVGVKALGKVLEAKFDVETKFIDVPTGL